MEQRPKQKKIPQRQCLGCNVKKAKKELLRVVRTPEGEIVLDFTGKRSGRGAYICRSRACLEKAVKSKALSRALETEITQEIYDLLDTQMKEAEQE